MAELLGKTFEGLGIVKMTGMAIGMLAIQKRNETKRNPGPQRTEVEWVFLTETTLDTVLI